MQLVSSKPLDHSPPRIGLRVVRTLLPILALSLLAPGCRSKGPAPPAGSEHAAPIAGASVHVTARISDYAPNAIEDLYDSSRPSEFFDAAILTLLSPPPFAQRVLRIGITEARKSVWRNRRGIVEFTISDADLSAALKPDSSRQFFDGVLQSVKFRP